MKKVRLYSEQDFRNFAGSEQPEDIYLATLSEGVARFLLDNADDRQREITVRHVETLLYIHETGRWNPFVGKHLAVGRDCRLKDGQNRLSAQVQLGVPVEYLLLLTDIPADEFYAEQEVVKKWTKANIIKASSSEVLRNLTLTPSLRDPEKMVDRSGVVAGVGTLIHSFLNPDAVERAQLASDVSKIAKHWHDSFEWALRICQDRLTRRVSVIAAAIMTHRLALRMPNNSVQRLEEFLTAVGGSGAGLTTEESAFRNYLLAVALKGVQRKIVDGDGRSFNRVKVPDSPWKQCLKGLRAMHDVCLGNSFEKILAPRGLKKKGNQNGKGLDHFLSQILGAPRREVCRSLGLAA